MVNYKEIYSSIAYGIGVGIGTSIVKHTPWLQDVYKDFMGFIMPIPLGAGLSVALATKERTAKNYIINASIGGIVAGMTYGGLELVINSLM